MDNIDPVTNRDGIDCTIGSGIIISRNFHHTAAETMQGFSFGALFSQLYLIQRIADIVIERRPETTSRWNGNRQAT